MKTYIFIITILLLTNIFLFVRLNSYQTQENNKEVSSDFFNIKRSVFLSEEIKENNEGLYIIKLFPEQTCNICLRKDVVIFNELYKNYSNKINIYVLNQEGSDELERFGAKFEYKILNEEEANNLFEQDIYIGNPITFLMYNTTSIDYFETKITHLEQSDFFHNRMKTILSRTTEE